MMLNQTQSLLPKIGTAMSACVCFQALQTRYIYGAAAVSALLHSAIEACQAAAR